MKKFKTFFEFFFQYIIFICFFLVGCASVAEISNGIFETRGPVLYEPSGINERRIQNQKNADEKCSSQSKLVDSVVESYFPTNDTRHSLYAPPIMHPYYPELVLRFKCIDPSAKRQRELDAFEANKKEQERQNKLTQEELKRNEEERKRNEEERKKFEAEQKVKEAERLRMEALKAAEWERTRPQREAAKRKALAEEEARLNSICPKYFIVRQSCAEAFFSSDCMRLRYGKDFSKKDHDTCFYR